MLTQYVLDNPKWWLFQLSCVRAGGSSASRQRQWRNWRTGLTDGWTDRQAGRWVQTTGYYTQAHGESHGDISRRSDKERVEKADLMRKQEQVFEWAGKVRGMRTGDRVSRWI